MQKIKYGVLDKLLRADLSRAEMDFILHISHYPVSAFSQITEAKLSEGV